MSSVIKTARIEARLTPEQKELIERAAAYEGQKVSEFILRSTSEAAKRVIEEHEVIRLNGEQSRTLVNVLLNPPKPNKAMKKAFKEYQQTKSSQSSHSSP